MRVRDLQNIHGNHAFSETYALISKSLCTKLIFEFPLSRTFLKSPPVEFFSGGKAPVHSYKGKKGLSPPSPLAVRAGGTSTALSCKLLCIRFPILLQPDAFVPGVDRVGRDHGTSKKLGNAAVSTSL